MLRLGAAVRVLSGGVGVAEGCEGGQYHSREQRLPPAVAGAAGQVQRPEGGQHEHYRYHRQSVAGSGEEGNDGGTVDDEVPQQQPGPGAVEDTRSPAQQNADGGQGHDQAERKGESGEDPQEGGDYDRVLPGVVKVLVSADLGAVEKQAGLVGGQSQPVQRMGGGEIPGAREEPQRLARRGQYAVL